MLNFYQFLTGISQPAFVSLLERRAQNGKEIKDRLPERMGQPSRPHPGSPLVWIHAASVGEAQSMLILIEELLKINARLHVLVTTGTATSAELMGQKLPGRSFHQFYPLDHPEWVKNFLDYWQPDLVFWMESELWPNMLCGIKDRNIPAILLNARLSQKSYTRWRLIKLSARKILNSFTLILTQTQTDSDYFAKLGATHLRVTGNLKFSARPLPASDDDLKILSAHVTGRPLWVFASTHKGEEDMACRVHQLLKSSHPELLTIIVPRHPDRRADIEAACSAQKLKTVLRGAAKNMPQADTDIYIADTMGELGLFYRLAPVACIGRSFSDDGGGGHNPIEAAQLNCAVLHGPRVKHFADIYTDMNAAGAAFKMNTEAQLADTLRGLFDDNQQLHAYQKTASDFAQSRSDVIKRVITSIEPLLEQADIAQFQNRANRA